MKRHDNGEMQHLRRNAIFRSGLLLFLIALFIVGCATINSARPGRDRYTVQNAHSHNDYEQANYFMAAYKAGFGSMEADIYLVNGRLLVAHNKSEVSSNRTLAAMYLEPLAQKTRANVGYPYANHQDQLELLIDLKDPKDSPAYQKAVTLIYSINGLKNSRRVLFTFTGNIPSDSIMALAPARIYFDGVPGRVYSKAALERIYMLSDNFTNYSNWKGEGKIGAEAYSKLLSTVRAAHKIGKKIRFWNAPDTPACWALMEQIGVDYINTDKIDELSDKLQ